MTGKRGCFPVWNSIKTGAEQLKLSQYRLLNMEAHQTNLTKLCRICAKLLGRNQRYRVTYNCTDYAERLELAFKVQTNEDQEEVHPKHFCNACYLVSYIIYMYSEKYWLVQIRQIGRNSYWWGFNVADSVSQTKLHPR